MNLRRLLPAALGAFLLVGAPARADDTSPFKDWKEVKQKDADHAKERAEFWANKGVEPKHKVWLGLMWNRAREYDKAQAALEEFLATASAEDVNRDNAAYTLVGVMRDKGDWAGVAAKAQAFRKEFPGAEPGLLAETLAEEGRAERMAGNEEKAIAAFTQSAEKAFMGGIVDLIDVHMCNGDLDEAKKVAAQYMAAENVKAAAKEQTLKPLVDFLDLVGKKAPALENVQQVGKSGAEVTSLEGKPTVFYFWNIPMGGQEFGFRMLNGLAKAYADTVQVAAISTYNKYNPLTKKVEEGLSEADEISGYKTFMEQVHGANTPPAIVVPIAVKEGLAQQQNTQKTVFDAEGKFRYARFIADTPSTGRYNWKCVEFALKKILGN